ncbi:MAG: amidohydrolase [Cytophagales bacterium]|jgi:amidohydrolase|nr:amidohydrolase [Cytophagales bacterium]MCA6386393.1 amidohydrolase [Cytophagales bacterium]MCA6390436.1 amidohydrolase [Cytophagales bacterium]MCA6395014.1 amidohydrolase [Cytophagales bacterium]MCA6397924.1 amidohydrolase [Cytophagales bacterium]
MKNNLAFLFLLVASVTTAQVNPKLQAKIEQEAKAIEPKLIEWRRHFHQNPELSNRETKTGAYIAAHLKSLGIEVQYPVAKTGVVGLLRGAKPGSVIALRADMDALPVVERNSLPFASKEKVLFNGQETGVMHACGHDAHMSILMAVAEILAKNKSELKGTVKFLFQPAEEGVAPSEGIAGAELMIKEGVLENPKVDVVFGLHVQSLLPSGQLAYRPGGLMAAVDAFDIKIIGHGAHGATPWDSVDPIVISGQVVEGLQTIVSRQSELTKGAVVITVGSLHAGIRRNIIPETATLEGTIRTFDVGMQKLVHEKIKHTVTKIAEASGATAEVKVMTGYPATYNDPTLTRQMVSSLERAAGKQNVAEIAAVTMAEDFSFFQQKVPGLFFFLGAYPAELNLATAPVHHTADFMIDEKSFVTGVKALLALTTDYMYLKK